MYNGKNVSLKTVLWKVMNHPLAADLNYDLAAEYALEGIRLLGAPLSLISKVSNPPIKVENHKAALPIDIIELKAIRGMFDKDASNINKFAMTTATDSFHNSESCDINSDLDCPEGTYIAENGVIKTSFANGYVEVSYKALPIDDDGFPLIPDNQKALLAIEYYILFRYLGPLYDMGKITDKAWNRIETSKCFYMPSASNDMKIQSYDHVESIMNGINRILINSNAHSNFFRDAGKKERLKRYN